MDSPTAARIEELLGSIPGTIAVARLDREQLLKVAELEAVFERSSVLPIHNVGVRVLAERAACFALLKDARFRPPRVPTVYLVEDGDGSSAPAGQTIVVNGARRRVIGEEVMRDRVATGETIIPLEESFVIYPDRRTAPDVPCTFILPPVAFPELEAEARKLGIVDILSISPSLASDTWIRTTFAFSPSNDFATLLVGCNRDGSA